jgi:septum formation protein
MPGNGVPRVVLASASAARAQLLRNAGLAFEQVTAAVDETEIKAAMRADGADAASVAMALAETKAVRVSMRDADALVIGADQMLEFEGQWFDKPTDRGSARQQLIALRGRSHRLISAACVLRAGRRLWGRAEHATLLMRSFSDDFLEAYLDATGEAATGSVGAYQVERLGVQLFARIDGDYFVILGLPLLPLLDFLRAHRVLRA